MLLDRRKALATLAGGAAAATALASGPAEALDPGATTSILLYNRSTGAWLVQRPESYALPGTRATGTNTARLAGRIGSIGVSRRWVSPTTGRAFTAKGVLTVRGSATVTPSWEVVKFAGGAWTRLAGGNLTFNGNPLIPDGHLLTDDRNVTVIGAQQSSYLSLTLTDASETAWSMRVRGTLTIVPQVDPAYAIAGSGAPVSYGMLRGASLTRFSNVNFDMNFAPVLLPIGGMLATIRGHVYGPVPISGGSVLLVYDRASGAAQFVALASGGGLSTARIVLSGRIAAGWTHVVPFRYGWFFYHRIRRCAQIATVAPQLYPSGVRWILRNGCFWPDGTMPDFTDAVGFG